MYYKIILLFCIFFKIFGQDENTIPLDSQIDTNIVSPQGLSVISVLQVVVILILMALALVGFLYILNNKNSNKSLLLDDGSFIKLIDVKTLPSNKFLYLVKVGSELILLSATETDVSLVYKITDQELLKDISENYKDNETFAQKLHANQTSLDPFSFIKKQSDKLKKM